jgi:hypothetical protein
MSSERLESLHTSEAFANYALRATFFARKLRELHFLDSWREVEKLRTVTDCFDWAGRERWGISADAWQKAGKSGIDPILCFLHPRVLTEQPSLLLYYRCIALLSQKGLQSLSGIAVADVETRRRVSIPPESRQNVVLAINSVLSVVVNSLEELHDELLRAFLYSSAGAQIQGSWNNAIGEHGHTVVKKLILESLMEEAVQLVWKNDSTTKVNEIKTEELRDRIPQVKVLRLTDGFHCIFSSEPDVSLRSPDEKPLIAVEVKAGTDPAGALERLGAATKSLDNERSMNPGVKTVYVASCITREVKNRIEQMNPFDHTFLLSELLADAKVRKRFAGLFVKEIVKLKRTSQR